MQYIGGSRGYPVHPSWDPILSFSHTFSPKVARVGGPRPLSRVKWGVLAQADCADCVDCMLHARCYNAACMLRAHCLHAACTLHQCCIHVTHIDQMITYVLSIISYEFMIILIISYFNYLGQFLEFCIFFKFEILLLLYRFFNGF